MADSAAVGSVVVDLAAADSVVAAVRASAEALEAVDLAAADSAAVVDSAVGGGFFNVGPDAVGKIKVTTVCLEHGKDDPNPRIEYELKPIDTFTKDQRVVEICKMIGRGEVSQEIAQAAAWHYTDDLSWEELARKIKIKHLDGSVEMFFSRPQLMAAMRVTQEAARRAELYKKSKSESYRKTEESTDGSDDYHKVSAN